MKITQQLIVVIAIASFLQASVANENLPVSQLCLGCICESISQCSTSANLEGSFIGPFAISESYWRNAGRPTVLDASSSDTEYNTFKTCTTNLYCAALTVQGYMKTHQKDCNNDGVIDCDDFALIHHWGVHGCVDATLPVNIEKRYQQCKDNFLINI